MKRDAQNDGELAERLAQWRVAPPADAQFRPAVWGRIEAVRSAASAGWATYLRRHGTAWGLAVVTLVGVAGVTGRAAGLQHKAAERDAVLKLYVAEIDARVMASVPETGPGGR